MRASRSIAAVDDRQANGPALGLRRCIDQDRWRPAVNIGAAFDVRRINSLTGGRFGSDANGMIEGSGMRGRRRPAHRQHGHRHQYLGGSDKQPDEVGSKQNHARLFPYPPGVTQDRCQQISVVNETMWRFGIRNDPWKSEHQDVAGAVPPRRLYSGAHFLPRNYPVKSQLAGAGRWHRLSWPPVNGSIPFFAKAHTQLCRLL